MALLEWNQAMALPLLWQADLLSLWRASLYYEPRPAGEQEVMIRHRLDEIYTRHPFLGAWKPLKTEILQQNLSQQVNTKWMN